MVMVVAILVFFAASLAANAQAIPNHFDPSARADTTGSSAVPSIRFLTTDDFPPFNYRSSNGELVGFHVDLARAICRLLDAACTIQVWPFKQAGDALADNQGDVLLAGLAIDEKNGARFDFSQIYLMFPARFVTRLPDVAGFDANTLEQRVIAVRKGSNQALFASRYLKGIKPAPFKTEIEALDAVASGAAYAYFGDAMRASFWLNDNSDCCNFAGTAYFRPDLFGQGLAAAFPAGQNAVRRAFNSALVRLKRSGELDEIYLRWFPVSFY
ncbi:ABC transporter, periplasmic amino acid-binding protein [hydrothermal vent metagenome]|uniref:ABC transporter, periplasmic amino acid-binding protein n=1 Tax=hydrothermal vent metagenome TaxID=652676 RepID=A0A3B0TRN6_9ZZZZ